MLINEPGELKLADGKHNIFGIFEYRSESSATIKLTNLITKAVIGVEKITWSGVLPSEDPIGDSNFFENAAAKFPEAGLTGSLIFPESNSPTNKPDHGVFVPRTKVEARAVLTIPVPAGMTAKLQARVLDPDHFGTGDFDPNKTNKGNDNVKGREKVGEVFTPLGMSHENFEFLFASEAIMASEHLEITEPQPGNNWNFGVHDEKIVTDQFHISPSNGVDILRAYRANQLFAIAETNKSKILTAGRTLWVEIDTMDAPSTAPGTVDDEKLEKKPLDISLLTELMRKALILVRELPLSLDIKTDSMPFVQYFATQGGVAKADLIRDVKSEPLFWVVQIIDAYEHSPDWDNDVAGADSKGNPNTRNAGEWYAGYAHREDKDQANVIYHETIRDVHKEGQTSDNTPGGDKLVDLETHMRILVAHEVLHRFLGYHTTSKDEDALHNSFIMSEKAQYDKSLAVLSDKQLRLIQNQKQPK
jgi:hypothetical protein